MDADSQALRLTQKRSKESLWNHIALHTLLNSEEGIVVGTAGDSQKPRISPSPSPGPARCLTFQLLASQRPGLHADVICGSLMASI